MAVVFNPGPGPTALHTFVYLPYLTHLVPRTKFVRLCWPKLKILIRFKNVRDHKLDE